LYAVTSTACSPSLRKAESDAIEEVYFSAGRTIAYAPHLRRRAAKAMKFKECNAPRTETGGAGGATERKEHKKEPPVARPQET
jgi:hypothetical protein